MAQLLTACPVCSGDLKVTTLGCTNCGLSLQNNFDLNRFNYLGEEEMQFLLCFLRNQGNLKLLQTELDISYPFAKKKLLQLLQQLDLHTADETPQEKQEDIDVSNLYFDENNLSASNIIKQLIHQNNGRITVTSARGNRYEIRAKADGIHFECDQLPVNPPYDYTVFDVMVKCLKVNGGSARKGNGRNNKLGHPDCDDTTLVGYIGKHYAGKNDGESVYDPVFVLISVLEWAQIAYNERGFARLDQKFINS